MGYDIDRFVNLSPDIADHFKCAVCLDIYDGPVELSCGHIYCLECIRSCFNSSNTIECPECRARIEFRKVKPPNRKLLGLLNNLTIKCEYVNRGCTDVVKVENLLVHTRECRFSCTSNRSHRFRSENVTVLDAIDIVLDSIFSGDLNDLEREQQLQIALNAYATARATEQNEYRQSGDDDDEFLIYDEGLGERVWSWIRRRFCLVIDGIFILFFVGASIAAIVISAVKLKSCNQIPTLPRALMALGISMFLSVVLETIRSCHYSDKFCFGLKFIQSFAIGSLTYLAVVVYSNLDYNINSPSNTSSTLTCDGLVFEYSFWFVSIILSSIVVVAIAFTLFSIWNNLKAIWSEWHGSYILLTFIYTIPIIGIIMSIGTVTIGVVYLDSCAAIPSLTTRLSVFGGLGVVCWLIMLLSNDWKNGCFWLFLSSLLVAFICLAVAVHHNFPWELTSHGFHAEHHFAINCNMTIYTYSFVTVCINYVIIGSSILMYSIYDGICACLFCR